MAMELFKARAGIDLVHIPFSATGPAVTQLLGGEVPIMFLPVHVAIAHVKAGQLVALAIGGGEAPPPPPRLPPPPQRRHPQCPPHTSGAPCAAPATARRPRAT